jgi:hypothetical protein
VTALAEAPESVPKRQWRLYPEQHTRRTNLALHLATVPLFQLGAVSLLAAPFVSGWLALGATGMGVALVVQGRGHRLESAMRDPFSSPWNFLARFFTEQFVSFPRFVLSGGFSRAWSKEPAPQDR